MYPYHLPTPLPPPAGSPFIEVTNVAPQFSGMALYYTNAYAQDGAPKHLGLSGDAANGTWLWATARFSGPLLKVYPLQDFPYDKQRLETLLESTQWADSEVNIIPSYDPEEVKRTILAQKSMLGWDVDAVTLEVGDHNYTQLMTTYKQVVMTVTVTRQAAPYGQRYIMPGFFIIIMLLLASIHAEGAVRVANGVAGFASILYLQFILNSVVPPLNYLTRLDKFMIISLIICFITCLLGGVHVYREVREKAAAKAAEGGAKKGDAEGGAAAVVLREPAAAPAGSPLQACCARRNPFSGGSVADALSYGVIFVAYSIASACVLLA